MKNKLRKIVIWISISFIGITILYFSILFYAYKSYSKYIDKNELDKYSLQAKLTETANIIKQGLQDRHIYKDYIYSLDIKPNNNILDFGTGWGNDAVFIAERLSRDSGKLTCLDIDNLTLCIARKRLENYKNVFFVCADITSLNIPENTYDAVVIYYVLHLIDKDILETTIDKLHYTLKRGGKLFVREPLMNPLEHKHLLSADEIRNLMIKTGFNEIKLVSSQSIDGEYQKK